MNEKLLRDLGLYPEGSPQARTGASVYTYLFGNGGYAEDLRRYVLKRALAVLAAKRASAKGDGP